MKRKRILPGMIFLTLSAVMALALAHKQLNRGKLVPEEVERVVPEAVTRAAAGFRSVAYSHLTPVLVEAVKEQQEQITAQQQTITELRRQNSALDARFNEQAARASVEITSFRKSFKEQQTLIQTQQSLIEQLQKSIERQELQINALKKLGCAITPNAEICKN